MPFKNEKRKGSEQTQILFYFKTNGTFLPDIYQGVEKKNCRQEMFGVLSKNTDALVLPGNNHKNLITKSLQCG